MHLCCTGTSGTSTVCHAAAVPPGTTSGYATTDKRLWQIKNYKHSSKETSNETSTTTMATRVLPQGRRSVRGRAARDALVLRDKRVLSRAIDTRDRPILGHQDDDLDANTPSTRAIPTSDCRPRRATRTSAVRDTSAAQIQGLYLSSNHAHYIIHDNIY